MRNPKPKSPRKIGPASTSAILPPPARHGKTVCRPAAQNKPSAPETRNTQHVSPRGPQVGATRSAPSESRITRHESPFESRITNHASRSRNGKVARLPYGARDMINRMLRNNIPHSQIVDALDELHFKVTERNISNWKTRGGYRDWCIAQEAALETRLLQDNLLEQLRKNDASQLAEVGLQLAATQLSQFFVKPDTREQLATEPEKFARTIGILCRLARQIHILQKHRDQSAKQLGPEHNPERIKHDTAETLESIRDTYSAEKPSESPRELTISHRNFLPKNGYPAGPPPDPPVDDTELRMRKFQELCDTIAAQNAAREAEWKALRQTSSPDSPAPQTFGAESEEQVDPTSPPQHSEPEISDPDSLPKNSLPNSSSNQ